MGLPGAGAERKDLASACALAQVCCPISRGVRLLKATGQRKGFGVPERRGLGVVWEL
jgi:hypothetical protein